MAAAVVGEAILCSILGLAIKQATSLVAQGFSKLWGMNEKVQILTGRLTLIKAFVRDAEVKQTTSEAVRLWLGELKDVAYDIEDLLEECATEAALQAKKEDRRAIIRWKRQARDDLYLVSDCFLSCCISNPTPISFHREIANKFESIEKRMDEIDKNRSSLGLVALASQPEIVRRETSPLREEGSLFIGREKEIKEIKEELLASVDKPDTSSSSVSSGGSSEGKIFVVGIVGMGGLGKTTLAQAIFGNEEVKASFTLREWVFVGEIFDAKRIIKDIIKDSSSTQSLHDLQTSLQIKVCDHRSLIILDDVWNNNPQDWEPLWAPLTHAKKGIAIVVTTRKLDVPKTKGPASVHELEGLPNEQCCQIFERRAFQGVNSGQFPRLEKLGREIVKKLKGLPLAASMIGGFLGTYLHNEKKWQWILNSTVWPETQEGDLIDQVVDLSYRHLPSHLKLCFAYCAIFPKDNIFLKERLIQMWIAQGYVEPQVGRQLEDVGSDYFDDLHQSSFFQFIESRYVMHDMIHDYAQKVFKEGCFTKCGEIETMVFDQDRGRHLSFSSGSTVNYGEIGKLCKYKKLRTLRLMFEDGEEIFRHVHSFAELKYLRWLELRNIQIYELPESIRSFKLLRFLGIVGMPWLEHLPSLGRLLHLKYLWIGGTLRGKKVGPEFYGVDSSSSRNQKEVFFPSLEKLGLGDMPEWEVWDAGLLEEVEAGAQGVGPLFFPSLRELALLFCPKLRELPAEVRRRLPALESLRIVGCPLLEERCREGGPYHPKIHGIHNAFIM